MDDLVQWLRAQLDEDERAARWAEDGAGGDWEARFTDHLKEHMGLAEVGSSFVFVDGFLDVTFGAAEHAARHDPFRVLREIEAKRRLVELHTSDGGHECPAGRDFTGVYVDYEQDCLTLRLLALPYADNPGYQEAWRP